MKKILLPALSVVFGALGLVLRQLQLHTGFDAAGLPTPGAPIHMALPALSAVFLLLAAMLLLPVRGKKVALTYDEAFRCENNVGYMMVCVLTVALFLCGTGLGALAYMRRELPNFLHLVLGVLMVASGYCLMMMGRNNYRALGEGRCRASLLLPAYTCAFWLILTYQQVSGEPILQSYIYRLLAVIFSLLAFYFMSGFSFEKGKPFVTLWSFLGAVYFSTLSLLDDRNWMAVAFLAAMLLYFTTHSAVLLNNLTAEREESTDE